MAILTNTQRQEIREDWARFLSSRTEPFNLNKADAKAAIDAVDNWVDANRASFNTTLPAAAQSGLTAAQKAELLVYVVEKRFKAGV